MLVANASASTVLAKPYEGEAGAVVWVTAKILRLVGTGKLSTNIVNNYLLGIGGPDANGDAYVYARLPTGKATVGKCAGKHDGKYDGNSAEKCDGNIDREIRAEPIYQHRQTY